MGYAKRDMSRREFAAALKRNNLSLTLLWITRKGGEGERKTIGVGVIVDRRGKLMRRATLAHALRTFSADDAATGAA